MSAEREALLRVQAGLFHLQRGLLPFVEARLRQRNGPAWRDAIQRAPGAPPGANPDTYALLKTIIFLWSDTFRDAFDGSDRHRARSQVTLALDARNAAAHASSGIADAEALRALDAMHELLRLTDAPTEETTALKQLYDIQRALGAGATQTPAPAGQTKPPSAPPADRTSSAAAAKQSDGSNAERVLAYIRAHPGLDDDELSRHLSITPRQTINQIARRLQQKGLIERVPGPRGKIVNRPVKAKP